MRDSVPAHGHAGTARALEQRDAPALEALDAALGLLPRDFLELVSPLGLTGYVRTTYGLELDGELVARADLVSSAETGKGYILRFSVRPNRRCQGHGGALLAYLLAEARRSGLRGLDLHVTEDNTRAINLYRRAGFKLKHCELHMQLSLTEPTGSKSTRARPPQREEI